MIFHYKAEYGLSNLYYLSNCLNVPSDIPDVFQKDYILAPQKQFTNEKCALKVKVLSVATSSAWQEYHRAKEMAKNERQIAVEKRKRKRQKMAEKEKVRSRGEEKAKSVTTRQKSHPEK